MHKVTYEPTPNPDTYRFSLPPTGVTEARLFKDARLAEVSPIAKKIFGFPWASEVLLGPDFLSVTKQNWVDWDILAEPLAGLIQEHVNSGEPFLIETTTAESLSAVDVLETDSQIVKDIKYAIAREIRPVVALDGGDVRFADLKDDILYISMRGACSGCPSSQATLKQGIEARIRELFPFIKSVESI
jgi:Fe-S cluster biogenesis protein NfuA